MKPIFKENPSAIGNIMDGAVVVGTYRMHTAEDSVGKREIFEISVSDFYVDKVTRTLNTNLRFVLQDHSTFNIIEDLGRGSLTFSDILYTYATAKATRAIFSKLPKKISDQNAN